MNLTDCRSSWLLCDQVNVGAAIAITRQVNFTLCPSYANALCGLITNLGAACRRSVKEMWIINSTELRFWWNFYSFYIILIEYSWLSWHILRLSYNTLIILLVKYINYTHRSRNRRFCISRSKASWATSTLLSGRWEGHTCPNSRIWHAICP